MPCGVTSNPRPLPCDRGVREYPCGGWVTLGPCYWRWGCLIQKHGTGTRDSEKEDGNPCPFPYPHLIWAFQNLSHGRLVGGVRSVCASREYVHELVLTDGACGGEVFTVGSFLRFPRGALREGLELQGRWEWRREGSRVPSLLHPPQQARLGHLHPLLLMWRTRASSTTAGTCWGLLLCTCVRVR